MGYWSMGASARWCRLRILKVPELFLWTRSPKSRNLACSYLHRAEFFQQWACLPSKYFCPGNKTNSNHPRLSVWEIATRDYRLRKIT